MTDQEIEEVFQRCLATGSVNTVSFARAIIAAQDAKRGLVKVGLFSQGRNSKKLCLHQTHDKPAQLVKVLNRNVTGGPYKAFWAYMDSEQAAPKVRLKETADAR